MPTYRSITLSLVSQFDILSIPEFAPPATPNDPFSNAPTLINSDHSVVSVYIPTYPASQFWLSYSISPPNPPKLLYYFKLYINGNFIVSWGCGEDEGYKGKTMFGLYDSSRATGTVKQSLFERRVLCFSPEIRSGQLNMPGNLSDVMEVRVFRSKGRKRIQPDLREYQSSSSVQNATRSGQSPQANAGINLVSAGFLSVENPRRYYKYALLDPLDQPFATFRYYYRTWDQLEILGVISPAPSTASSPVRSLTPEIGRVSPRSRENTLESLVSLSNSLQHRIAESPSSMGKQPVRNDSTDTITKVQSPTNTSTTQSSTDSSEPSPLIIPRLNPLRMHRPPTPPPMSSPSKTLAQLPPTIPPTISTSDLNLRTLNPRSSFASLIRTHLSDPDPDTFRLKNPAEEHPASPTRVSQSARTGTLMGVVHNAKKRRPRPGDARRGSSVSITSEESGSSGVKSQQDETREGVKVIQLEREKKLKAKEERMREKKRKEQNRKLHLWEEI